MSTLATRHALITGGATGIGLAAAEALAACGVRVTLAARNGERLAAAAERIGAHAVTMDVRDEASVAAAFAAARRQGPIDILVANAGIALSAPLAKTDLALWSETLAVNLTGAYLCARAALPDMQAAGWGRIVNVASIAALKGYAYIAAYAASKHGLLGFTRALAQETAKSGVTVNAVCPGYVDTDIVARAAANIADKTGMDEAAARAALYRFNPQERLIAPAEVAAAIVWLCSDAAASVNGAAIPITGGEI